MTSKALAPKKVWQNINGIVLLNKPENITSNGLLQQVRRLYNAKKAGHTGALDPFATGLLPICFGEATKVSGLLLDANKRYQATLQLGIATDSGDKEGCHVAEAEVPTLTEPQIKQVLNQFLGHSTQVPPMYSALKFQGKPLYEYARRGIEIERPAREINVMEITLVSFSQQTIVFEVLCSKGTYVRTLGEDIAKALGTLGHLVALHRTQTGAFLASEMHTLDEIANHPNPQALLLPLDAPLGHLAALQLDDKQTAWVQQGGKLQLPQPQTDLVRFYNPQGQFIGIGEWQTEKQLLKPKRLFNLA